MEKKKKQYGILAVIFKLGTKFASILAKILKSAKVVKVGLAAASLVSYSYLFSWQFAIIIMSMLFIHESGHVWAMKRRGIATKGFYFIPLLGGAAIAEESFKTRDNEAYIALMGPIWGLVLSIGVFGLYYVTSNPLFAAASSWMALINLVNLIPINPLDGGRILKSLALSVGVNSEIMRKGVAAMLAIGSICIIIACAVMGLWLFVLLGSLGLLEVILEIKKPSTMVPMSSGAVIKYFALSILVGGLLFSIMYYTKHLPGSDIAMQFLKE